MQNLRLLLRGMDELHISEEQVFFDRNNLLAGDDWDETIQCALEEADYFIFLVSTDSLNSSYCYSRELEAAARRRLPIIQIVLKDCPWEHQPIPGDARKRKLGALGAIPKDAQFQLRPIARWASDERDRAWNCVVKQLAEKLQEKGRPSAAFSARPSQTLLPFFCNQVGIVNRFNDRVTSWGNRAMLVLTRGLYEDNLAKFWDRLRTKDLTDYLTANNGQLIDQKPFAWPFLPHEKPSDGKESLTAMLQALSDALTGNKHLITDIVSLSQWLSGQPATVPLFTQLPNGEKAQLAAGLKVLLHMLEQSPVDTALDKLIVTASIEAKSVLHDSDLSQTLALSGYQRTHIIDLPPLQEIERNDIRSWHLTHKIETDYRVTEDTLLDRVFGDTPPAPLRLRTFANKVQDLL
jgi:hypothetical protein